MRKERAVSKSHHVRIVVIAFILGGMSCVHMSTIANSKNSSPQLWFHFTLVKAEIWPVDQHGACWDFCGFAKPKIPKRELHLFKWYMQFPSFEKRGRGWSAPDVQVKIETKYHSFRSYVRNNTLTPLWNQSFLIRLAPRARINVQLFDKDLIDSETIGEISWILPHNTKTTRTWTIQKFGQVENLSVRIRLISTWPRNHSLKNSLRKKTSISGK